MEGAITADRPVPGVVHAARGQPSPARPSRGNSSASCGPSPWRSSRLRPRHKYRRLITVIIARARAEVGPRQGNSRATLCGRSNSTPGVRQGQPRTHSRSCGNQPAHQSLITDVQGAPPPPLRDDPLIRSFEARGFFASRRLKTDIRALRRHHAVCDGYAELRRAV